MMRAKDQNSRTLYTARRDDLRGGWPKSDILAEQGR